MHITKHCVVSLILSNPSSIAFAADSVFKSLPDLEYCLAFSLGMVV